MKELPTARKDAPAASAEKGCLAQLLTAIFQEWSSKGIEFLVLRNYEGLPHATGNDVDILLARQQFGSAETLMIEAAESCGYALHNRVEFATVSFFFFHVGSLEQIQIDLFTETRWHCFDLVSTTEVLSRRRPLNKFAIPHPVDETVIALLGRLLYQGKVRDKYKEQISAAFQREPTLARDLLTAAFGQKLASFIVKCACEKAWDSIDALSGTLRRKLVLCRFLREPLATMRAVSADACRFFRRLRQPGGIIVAVLGPDGSGKSTVSNIVMDRLRNTFNPGKTLRVHWKPVIFLSKRRRGSGQPNTNPHGKPPRNAVMSLSYLVFHWIEYMVGSHLLFRRSTFKNGLVLVDRYYHDFLVDKRRYRLSVPDSVIELLGRAVKQPDLIFVFVASAGVLQARKREVPMEESARQVDAYKAIGARFRQTRILDAAKSVDMVASEMMRGVLEFMRGRMERRGVRRIDGSEA